MALKRTLAPLYGKREAAFTRLGAVAMRSNDRDRAAGLFEAAANSIRRRYERHIANGRRKACNAGKSGHRNVRGY